LHAKNLKVIAEDPASIVTQTAEAADRPESYHDMAEVTKGNRYSLSKTSDDMAQLHKRADGTDNLNIVTF
jgi:hypothetical protein